MIFDSPLSQWYNDGIIFIMTLTPEQYNKLVTKEDLKDFATKEEMN